MQTQIKPDFILQRIMNASRLLLDGRYIILFGELKRQYYSETVAFGLQRDLSKDFDPPVAKINFTIRPLEQGDIAGLLDMHITDPVEKRAISDQQGIINAGIPGCYVAVTEDNKPCYMQWLISSEHNDLVSSHFRGLFPELTQPEVLLEGAYTPPAFRGLGIMPAAMAQIARMASGTHSHLVNTFVDINNIASLKGCRRAGFEPYILRRDRWYLFHRVVTFHPLPAELLDTYHQNTGASRN